MQALLKGAGFELVACDTSQQGWTQVTLTPEAATAQWRLCPQSLNLSTAVSPV